MKFELKIAVNSELLKPSVSPWWILDPPVFSFSAAGGKLIVIYEPHGGMERLTLIVYITLNEIANPCEKQCVGFEVGILA